MAVMALDQTTARLTRRAMLPEKVGKGWTWDEERQLKDEFNCSGNQRTPALETETIRWILIGDVDLQQRGSAINATLLSATPNDRF